ncbi:MAG: DUF378 domain-containing protein [Chlamydiales bacterium]|nr:DUF378 domain-containing protein [Chlamydiales bacterium]
MHQQHHILNMIAKVLLIIGGINWGLVGLFQFNLVGAIFGEMHAITRIIYILVGLAAIYKVVCWSKCNKKR